MTFMAVQGPGWCPWCAHMGWGGWIMMISWILLLVLLVAAVWWLAQGRGREAAGGTREDSAEAILRERYARGEIDEAIYRRQLDELRRS